MEPPSLAKGDVGSSVRFNTLKGLILPWAQQASRAKAEGAHETNLGETNISRKVDDSDLLLGKSLHTASLGATKYNKAMTNSNVWYSFISLFWPLFIFISCLWKRAVFKPHRFELKVPYTSLFNLANCVHPRGWYHWNNNTKKDFIQWSFTHSPVWTRLAFYPDCLWALNLLACLEKRSFPFWNMVIWNRCQ